MGLLRLKQGSPDSWYTFCMAWELLGHYDEAIDVMMAFEKITESSEKLKLGKVQACFENGERKLYIAKLYQQAGRFQEALDYLKNSEDIIVDKHGLKVIRAEILMKMEDFDGAKVLYRELIDTNPENYDFHLALLKAYKIGSTLDNLSDEQISELEKLYAELRKEYPRCSALKTIPLRFHKAGDTFKAELDSYLQPALRKGIPSLFATLQFFYEQSPAKATIIGDTIQSYYQSLKETERFPGDDSELVEPPLSLFWTILFLAQHHDQLGDTETALKFIDEAIAHTPTVVDIYSFRADIYKNAGAYQKAADAMDECRQLDLADRYLNTKTTLYLLRADRVEQADATVELFITDAYGNQVSLSEMQCVWFEQAAADSYLRLGDIGNSLKKALSINSHFEEFIEDQFDFHSYCIRKLTLRAYRDLLSFEDRLYSHDNYFNAARVLVKNYLRLHEQQQENSEEKFLEGLTGKDLQRAKTKWKKLQRKKQQEEEKRKAELAKQNSKKKVGGTTDDDPDGYQLTKIDNPMEEAAKFASSLEKWCSDRLETHLLSFEVFYKKMKYLRSIRALKKAIAFGATHFLVHYQTIQLALVDSSTVDEAVRSVFEEQRNDITKGASPAEINAEYGKQNSENVLSQFSVAMAELLISPDKKDALKERLTTVDPKATREDCETILPFIEKIYGANEINSFCEQAHKKFPFVSMFEKNSN